MTEQRPEYTAGPQTCGECRYCLVVDVAADERPRVCTLWGVGVADLMPACKQWAERAA